MSDDIGNAVDDPEAVLMRLGGVFVRLDVVESERCVCGDLDDADDVDDPSDADDLAEVDMPNAVPEVIEGSVAERCET